MPPLTRDLVIAELAARTAPDHATPDEKAAHYRAVREVVRAAGSRAVPAWVLVRDLPAAELMAAFVAQAEALKLPPLAPEQKQAMRNWAGRRTIRSPYMSR